MSKDKISDYSATANSNTDIGGINIDEGCAPSGINDAIRTLMKQLKDFQQGTNSDPFNGPHNGTVGATTPASGAFTTLSASSTLSVTGAGTIQGLTVGKGAGSVSTNTAVGASALAGSNSGTGRNVAIGLSAMAANTSGQDNTAVGWQAMLSNTTGTTNTAVGRNALVTNTTGSSNTGIGLDALALSTTANNNTAVGYQAGYSNTTGNNITAVGYQAGYSNSIGTNNTFMGRLTGYATTTANYNTAMGSPALYQNTTGASNTAIGDAALYWNTTGSNNTALGASSLQYNTTASNNTAVGYQAGYSGTTASDSTYVGNFAGYGATTGTRNTLVGFYTGSAITTGTFNNFFGTQAGQAVTTGGKNTILGSYSGNQGGLDIRTASNNIVISDGDGFPLFGTQPSVLGPFLNATGTYTQLSFTNTMVQKASIWWDNSLLRLQTYTGTTNGPYISNNGTSWTNSSDERLKNITGEIQNGLAKVCTLRAAEYTWKADQEAKPQVGLIAQDVLAVLPEAVTVPEEGATEKDGSPAMMGVQYNEVIPLLVAAIKELKAEIDTLKGQA